ncbi:MAG: hypothetical protein BGN85_11920 [Alphaproteobacteria bacterium 64-11]|nr:hypothetical protein [Alphaproteobacteria bacterium]OJU11524.1 MAG: hypothetical protein BGN85_11920 [Alphaproteobacteria bacterium 64-11]
MTGMRRRRVLQVLGAAPAATLTPAAAQSGSVSLLIDAAADSAPLRWAAGKLKDALARKNMALDIATGPAAAKGTVVAVAGPGSRWATGFAAPPRDWASPECLRLVPGRLAERPALLVSAQDPRGFVYALLDLAERVDAQGSGALNLKTAIAETTPNRIRSVARAFLSEIEDMPWFHDRDGWRDYLDMVTACRFNRFNFALGFGYDFPRGVTGDYLHFPYPYLVEVPGHDVTITPALKPGERERNLQTLKFIARETGARGLDFQLGIWTHAWAWTDSPHSDHVIGGIRDLADAANYNRDALAILLKECPEITGVTLRVHGESGIPEGNYPFWQTLFEAIAQCGRKVNIDMHAKGIDQTIIDIAAKTGQPVSVGPKFSAEHQSLGYHQADIRELEIPTPGRMETGTFAVSNGARRFTRYGYADLYQEGRSYDILYRLWPGTQRHLLSADPALASAIGRAAHFCGAAGLEVCEPLTFKGREGSGHPGGRNAYAVSRHPKDWRKFADNYRLLGRMLYNPEGGHDFWRRTLAERHGKGAMAAGEALAAASRVLPLMTSASLPSASNHSLWYEVYTNQPLVAVEKKNAPYSDTPAPYNFGACSPLDPQLFSTIDEHAGDLLAGGANARYSPAEVAVWLGGLAKVAEGGSPALDGLVQSDVRIQAGLARFFAAKLRAGLYYALWQKADDAEAGRRAVAAYGQARAAWAELARQGAVYRSDISYGRIPMRRGHWTDRLAAIDADIAAVRAAVARGGNGDAAKAMAAVANPPVRPQLDCRHDVPAMFTPGSPLPLALTAPSAVSATLFYRHVNHGERWLSMAMTRDGAGFGAAIPAAYTGSPYPLQYYFVPARGGQSVIFPGFNADFSSQPYYAVWKRA